MLIGDLDNFDPENPAEGMYPSMTEEVYRSARAWNWSTLRHGSSTMSKVKWHADHPDAEKDTDDKAMGRCFHAVLLQADRLDEIMAVQPVTYEAEVTTGRKPNKVTKIETRSWNNGANVCKAWAAKQKGKEIVTAKNLTRAKEMAAQIRALPGAMEILDGALYEVPIFWRDGVPDKQKGTTGLMCKARLDIFKNGQIGEAKKVQKGAAWEQFSGHVKAYRHYAQAACYLDGVMALMKLDGEKMPELPMVRFLVAEDAPPYDPAIYDLYDREGAGSQAWLKAGRLLWHGILQRVAFCLRKGVWPGHNADNPEGVTEVEELEPPEWVVKKLETM